MKFTQIRNATTLIEYAGVTFLTDPYLSPKRTSAGFKGSLNEEQRNPTVDLPFPVEEIVAKADCVLLSHTHLDHWDDMAAEKLPKNLKIFVQAGSNAPIPNLQPENLPANNADLLRFQGFTTIETLKGKVTYKGITITPTAGQHGDAEVYGIPEAAALLGDAIGFILQAPSEPTLYLVGDTIWTKEVAQTLEKYRPDVVVLNAGCAKMIAPDGQAHAIIMGAEDFVRVHRFLPQAQMIATHMEAVNHASLSRAALREFIKAHNLEKNVLIPEDGQTLEETEFGK